MHSASAASTAIRSVSLPGDGGFLAVVADDVTRETVSRVAAQQGWPHARVERGGIGAALAAVERAAPRLLLVDLSDAGEPVAALDALADRCPPDTAVLAIGAVNDVALYRRLIGMGVADYLVKPVSAETLQEALLRAAAPRREAPVAPGEARPARVVAMVGARGGVGTTTAAIATAWCMAHEHGLRVTLLDLDLHFGSLALQLDLEARRGLGEALQNPERIDALLLAGAMSNESERLRVLAAEEPLEEDAVIEPDAADALIAALSSDADAIVVDLPRRLDPMHRHVLTAADTVAIVTDLSLPAMRDAARLVALCKRLRSGGSAGTQPLVIVNRVTGGRGEVPQAEFEKAIGAKINAVVPFDGNAATAAAESGKAWPVVARSSKATATFRRLAPLLSGTERAASRPSLLRRLFR
jgi:pilus assembly protein CpaE